MQIAVVVGTRPEAIKLAPVTERLGHQALVVHTGQHFSTGMSGPINPDINLTSTNGTSRGHQLGEMVSALDKVFDQHHPDAVLVQGDTTSALAGALAANCTSTPLVHLEAGLRSFDRQMPEEHHRVLIDHLADLCCAPTELALKNLLAERIPLERIDVTGNTVVEAATAALPAPLAQAEILARFGLVPGRFVLATIHRPENTDNPVHLTTILRQLTESPIPVVFPLHPRTRRQVTSNGLGTLAAHLVQTPPLDYPTLLTLIANAAGLVTDSGGIQEEATILKRPILVVRRSNERPEAEAFGSRTTPDTGRIPDVITTWIHDADTIAADLSNRPTPFGDGTASDRVIQIIRTRFSP